MVQSPPTERSSFLVTSITEVYSNFIRDDLKRTSTADSGRGWRRPSLLRAILPLQVKFMHNLILLDVSLRCHSFPCFYISLFVRKKKTQTHRKGSVSDPYINRTGTDPVGLKNANFTADKIFDCLKKPTMQDLEAQEEVSSPPESASSF
jgi:hypothetical protein